MKPFGYTLLCLLAAVVLLAGCAGAATRREAGAPAPSAPAESAAASKVPAEHAEAPEEPAESTEPSEIEAVKAAILPVVRELEFLPNQYPQPTGEQYGRMLDAVEALGLPAASYNLDTRNADRIVRFCEDAAAGKDGELTVYQISNAYLTGETFRREGGAITRTASYWNFGAGPDAEISSEPAQALDRFELQPGGHLLYNIEEYGDLPMGFRVLPLGEENRVLARKYVRPVCHTRFGVTSSDWDENDLSGIHWEWTFEGLLMARTGETIMDAYPEPCTPGTEYPYAVPAKDVDGTLTAHFPVTAEQLHRLSAYDPQREIYAWQGFWGGTDFREPEVVERIDNADGSFTLRVNFVGMGFYESGESCELTIRDNPDGTWTYLSNRHHPMPKEE